VTTLTLISLACCGAQTLDEESTERIALSVFDHDTEVQPQSIQVEGQDVNVWQTSSQNRILTFRAAHPITTPASRTEYLNVTYLDRGYGRLTVHYQDANAKTAKPDKFTSVVLSESGKWVTSLMRLSNLPDAVVPDIQVSLEKGKDNSLAIAKAALQANPFTDSHFQYILDEAWKRPYEGPSIAGVDNTTLKGKVMVGFQGWFRTPNDPSDEGWIHWGDITQGHFTTDMWPDTSAYPAEDLDKADDVKTLSGKPGYLFSSAWPEVVRVQFSWMRQNNIDGAFAQRFLGDMNTSTGRPDWVLGNVRAAAHQEGRIWAVEYDVSGAPDAKVLDILKKDWMWMVDDFGIKKDSAYAREGGKPVVFIWGLSVPGRNFTPESANAVIDFFKNDPTYGGNYVIGGIPGSWRKLSPAWQDHIKRYNGVLAWLSKTYQQDVTDFKAMGVDYYPHVNPGFSWANLKHLPTGSTEQFTPRQGGKYYETMFSQAAQAGADRLFVGMFDEYDEGTAIMPMSDDPPPTPSRPGTTVKYFANPQFQERPETAYKPLVEQAFDGAMPSKKTPASNYMMRWEGQLIAPADGRYTLEVAGVPNDFATLWLDDKQVLKTRNFGEEPSQTISIILAAGHPVIYRLDYTHLNAPGGMRFVWQGPSIPGEEVPATALVDAWGRFITNEGHPAGWYLKLTSEAKDMITGKRSPTDLSIK
jgi:hypothetical protein